MLSSFRFASRAVSPSVLGSVSASQRYYARKAKSDNITIPIETEHRLHRCEGPSTTEITTTKDEMLTFYEKMYRMRRLEVAADVLYKQRMIRGFLHLYNGQEAVAMGMLSAMRPDDAVITAYRDHAFSLMRGGDLFTILSELIGKSTGVSKGKGGSMHLFGVDHHFYGGNAIVGAQVPVGAGLSFAQKYEQEYNNTGGVTMVAYGDGAANQGQIFETFNMAYIWKLPCIFVVENNGYGMGTSISRAASNTDFYLRGDFVPGMKVDGMDVYGVKHAMEWACEFARSQGPIVLEMMTYRYVGHSMSDPGTTYRTREEVDAVRKKQDPIERLKDRLFKFDVASPDDVKAIEKAVRKEVDDALKEAKAAPDPDLRETFTEILKENLPVRAVERVNNFVP